MRAAARPLESQAVKNSHLVLLVALLVLVSGSCGGFPSEPILVSAFADTIQATSCSDDAARAVFEDLTTCWDLVESTGVERDDNSGAWVLHIGVTDVIANPPNSFVELQGDALCQLASDVWPDWVVLDGPDGKPVRWDARSAAGDLACTPDETAFRAGAKACECEIPPRDELVQIMRAKAELGG